MKIQELTDEELVKKYNKKQDQIYLETLIKRYLGPIFGFVRRYVGNADTASDITQEVFVKVWQNIKRFDTNKSFKPWIFTIAKNTALDWLKKKDALPFSFIEQQVPNFSENIKDDSAMAAIDNIFSQKDFALAIGQLPGQYESIIKLHTYDGFNFREISQIMREPLNTVKSRYRRGLALLKKTIRL